MQTYFLKTSKNQTKLHFASNNQKKCIFVMRNNTNRMENKFRCSCPCTSALDIIGDKWTLVIIKDMILSNKQTFKDFHESDEGIATNILSTRLKMLTEYKIIRKGKLPNNKQKNIYTLTEKGLDLTTTIVDLMLWSDRNLREYHSTLIPEEQFEPAKKDKEGFINMLVENYKKKNWLHQEV
ncbi:helix-turn-helix transcriptional regulator [bacterium]|nr:helix-turn-helix transcriptional regulator [bacterium]